MVSLAYGLSKTVFAETHSVNRFIFAAVYALKPYMLYAKLFSKQLIHMDDPLKD
jgi:hypothetical protein